MKIKIKPKIFISFLSILIILLIIISTCSLYFGLNNKKENTLSYNENGNVDYKVYLKENKDFTEKYLSKEEIEKDNKTIISTLIDYIDINFSYNLTFDDLVNGTYEYYFVTTIVSDHKDSEKNYWSKELEKTTPSTITIKKQQTYTINQSFKLDYDKYNEIASEFKKKYGLSSNNYLKLELIVKNKLTNEMISTPINLDSTVKLEVPLVETTIELTINSKNTNEQKIIKEKYKEENIIYKILDFIGIFTALLSVVLILVLIKYIINNSKTYKSRLNKILNTYNNIIVNVNNLPNTEELDLVEVDSFNELLDAHSEVRQPINFYEEKKNKKGYFLLTNGQIAWIYILTSKK